MSVECRVAAKGGVSVYGLQRYPVTLYKEQWRELLAHASEILAFIEDNEGKLKSRGDGGSSYRDEVATDGGISFSERMGWHRGGASRG